MSKKIISAIFYLIGSVFIGSGFYKLLVYKNYDGSKYPSLAEDNVNAYVGGDAYNYIINMGFATSLFIMALICVVIASTFLILEKMDESSVKSVQGRRTTISSQSDDINMPV
jgi:hypothetical protein